MLDQLAGRRKGRRFDSGRIDPDLHPLTQQIFDQAIERLVRTVAHVIVIARKQGHAEFARLHGAGL